MVTPADAVQGNTTGKKRDSSELEQDSSNETSACNHSSEMKKPRIRAGEEIIEGDGDNDHTLPSSNTPSKSQMDDIKARIRKYLEVCQDQRFLKYVQT